MKATLISRQSPKTTAVVMLIMIVAFIFIFVLFTYTFLHESGHAITSLLFGQKLTVFNINFINFSARVGMVGHLTQAQLAIQSVAGAGLPLVIWFVFISFVPRKGSFSLEVLKLLSSMAVLNTLLAWMVIPILYLFGNAPSDDVTNFLRYSSMPPLLLTFTAIVLYVGGWALFLSKIDGLRNEFLLFRTTDHQTLTTGARKLFLTMTGILALCILLTFVLNAATVTNSKFTPPQDFEAVIEIDLSTQSYSAESVAQFSLEKPTYVGVFIAVRNINTTYFDLRLIGPDGYSSIILHGEGYRTDQDGGLWEENLPAGNYQLMLTSQQSSGTASIYLKTR